MKTWLISYPRTGSHLLRMMIYFYYNSDIELNNFNFSTCSSYEINILNFEHVHDYELDKKFQPYKYVYLYRKNISFTIFSLLKYWKKDVNDKKEIKKLTLIYINHIKKYLINVKSNKKFITINYEYILKQPLNALYLIIPFIKPTNIPSNIKNFKEKLNNMTKKLIKDKTQYDLQYMNIQKTYENERNIFNKNYEKYIQNIVIKNNININEL